MYAKNMTRRCVRRDKEKEKDRDRRTDKERVSERDWEISSVYGRRWVITDGRYEREKRRGLTVFSFLPKF
jgi:hypothetical protein